MKTRWLGLSIFLSVILIITSNSSEAQQATSKTDSLYNEISRMDSILFNALNTRNIELFKTMFTEDLEFYHDKGGLTGYQHTIDFLKDISVPGNDLKRELVKGSLEVYPIPGYGAMEIGAHTFCHTEGAKKDCGTFSFVHIWQRVNGAWKISRVVSYGH